MTPYQLDESANAPCTRTMVGLAGCAVAAAPVSKRPTDVRIATKIFILSLLFLPSARGRMMRAVVRSRRPDCCRHGAADGGPLCSRTGTHNDRLHLLERPACRTIGDIRAREFECPPV